jgi:hypothetical protein
MKSLVKYLPDFMRFCSFLTASVHNGIDGKNRRWSLCLSAFQSNPEIGLGGTRTLNQRLKRALLYH